MAIGLVELAGIAALVLYIVWMLAFFQYVRPRVMDSLGHRIGVRVDESADALDAGTYSIVGNAPLAKHGAIALLDVIVLLIGTVGVCALLSIPGFLIAETGAPYRWESILLGTGVHIADAQIPPLDDNQRSTALVQVVNEANAARTNCLVSVDGYTASNGYLTGMSAFFSLTPHEARTIELELSALRTAPGEHELILKLECENRIKEKVRTSIKNEG